MAHRSNNVYIGLNATYVVSKVILNTQRVLHVPRNSVIPHNDVTNVAIYILYYNSYLLHLMSKL